MKRVALASAIVMAGASLVAIPAFGQTLASPAKLVGVVGKQDAFVITLKTANGKLVKKLKAGRYTFVIHDNSAIHAFDLDGPHAYSHDFTKIPFKGTVTATLNLKPGKYKAYCPNHESQMFQFFTVTK
jgi:hypothetical protein